MRAKAIVVRHRAAGGLMAQVQHVSTQYFELEPAAEEKDSASGEEDSVNGEDNAQLDDIAEEVNKIASC